MMLYLVKFATDRLGLHAGVVGALFGASRVWDAISDPLVATYSDRPSGKGRRLRTIRLGAFALAASVVMLWAPPTLGTTTQAVWFGVAICFYFTAHTLVFVPYDAIGIEGPANEEERNRWFAFRAGAYGLASLAGVGLLFAASDQAYFGQAVALVGAVGIVVSGLYFTRDESRYPPGRNGDARAVYVGFREIIRDRVARLFFAVRFLQRLGSSALTSLAPFITALYLGNDESLPLIMGVYTAATLLTIFATPRTAAAVGTFRLWKLCIACTSLGLLGLCLTPRGALGPFMAIVLWTAVTGALLQVTERSVMAEIALSLEDKHALEARFAAVDTFLSKCAFGIAVAIGGAGLSAAGYTNDMAMAGAHEGMMRATIAGIPMLTFAAAAALALKVQRRVEPTPTDGPA